MGTLCDPFTPLHPGFQGTRRVPKDGSRRLRGTRVGGQVGDPDWISGSGNRDYPDLAVGGGRGRHSSTHSRLSMRPNDRGPRPPDDDCHPCETRERSRGVLHSLSAPPPSGPISPSRYPKDRRLSGNPFPPFRGSGVTEEGVQSTSGRDRSRWVCSDSDPSTWSTP